MSEAMPARQRPSLDDGLDELAQAVASVEDRITRLEQRLTGVVGPPTMDAVPSPSFGCPVASPPDTSAYVGRLLNSVRDLQQLAARVDLFTDRLEV